MTANMSGDEVTAFKKLINAEIDFAIDENGGMATVREAYKLMPSLIDFLAGWVTRSYWIHRQAQLYARRHATQEEIRRIYDLVRLRLDTESSTS